MTIPTTPTNGPPIIPINSITYSKEIPISTVNLSVVVYPIESVHVMIIEYLLFSSFYGGTPLNLRFISSKSIQVGRVLPSSNLAVYVKGSLFGSVNVISRKEKSNGVLMTNMPIYALNYF